MTRRMNHDAMLKSEVWAWYGVGITWLLLRLFVRIRTLGLFHLQLDDFFAFLVLVTWTIMYWQSSAFLLQSPLPLPLAILDG